MHVIIIRLLFTNGTCKPYFPTGNRVVYNKPAKVPLMLIHYTGNIAPRCGLEALGFTACYISLSSIPLCNASRSALAAILHLIHILYDASTFHEIFHLPLLFCGSLSPPVYKL